ncbi:MAG: transposase [Planctomycetia bacterium]|nr:transposase [Planctomycetia bacterium]
MALPEIPAEERTPLVEALLGVIRQLQDRVAELEGTVQQLRAEIAILKGQKPKPQIKPSQLESPAPRPRVEGAKRPGSQKRSKNAELTIHQEVPLHPPDLPAGAVFKGYEPFVVQELKIESENTRYLRTRYELPTGGSVLAPLPADIQSHFGPGLICYILEQYYHARVTQPLLPEQLHDFGINISAGQLSRILTENHDAFHQEQAELLTAGLETASYIGTDDTGARHQGKNGYCTVSSHELFAYFESTACKSRLNFLQVLQGGSCTYAINETMRAYGERQKLAAAVVQKLTSGPLQFAAAAAWQARLTERTIDDERHVRIATEGALLGGLLERGVSRELVILSDGAPQFDLWQHASCWIHAERPLAKLVPHNDEHRAAIEKIRQQIWELYRDLKAYREQPDAAQKPLLEARFDALVEQQSGYPSIQGVLKEMRAHRTDLLRVLERPEVPLHNNASESDIREYVTKRKIRGSTRSASGRRCRDTFASLKKTCRKLGARFWDYLQDRVRGLGRIARLADMIRQRAKARQAALA